MANRKGPWVLQDIHVLTSRQTGDPYTVVKYYAATRDSFAPVVDKLENATVFPTKKAALAERTFWKQPKWEAVTKRQAEADAR